jgi:PAS domain S-box-containing protein
MIVGPERSVVQRHGSMVTEVAALAWAFESSSDLVFAADARGGVLFANPALRQRSGVDCDVPLASLLPAALTRELDAAVSDVLRGLEPRRVEWGELDASGARAWYVCTVSPLVVEGKAAGYLCISQDVTELKRTEERLRRSEQLMVDTQGVAHLGTWEWDVEQPTAIWSAELYRIYGLTPEGYTPSYERYLEMVHPDDRARVAEATQRVFDEQVPYSHDERIFRADGSMRYLHTWAYPVADAQGRLVRLLGVCQDITEQKLAEQQVIMASHDLRAPLSTIQGSTALILMQTTSLPEVVVRNVERIQRATRRMTTLVNDLLALAQVGHAALTPSEVDLTSICLEIVEQLRAAEPERNVELEVAPELTCLADAGLMRVVMNNLLGNAWKYSAAADPARIQVGAKDEGGLRSFFVRDNGVGFDMKDAHRLFEPFQRLHSQSHFAGTGVGLAGAQRILERHGGRIWGEGAVGEGATFWFQLPVA